MYWTLMLASFQRLPPCAANHIEENSEEPKPEVSGRVPDWLLMSARYPGKTFGIPCLDLTRHKCNSYSVKEADGRVTWRFLRSPAEFWSSNTYLKATAQLCKVAKVYLPCLLSTPPLVWAYLILNSTKHRKKQRPIHPTASCSLPSVCGQVQGMKERKRQRWVSGIFQGDVGHLCVCSSNSSTVTKFHISSQTQSNDAGSLDC